MYVARETVWLAFYAYLQTIPGIVTVTRRLQHWADTPNEKRPALYLRQKGEARQQAGKRGLPPLVTLQGELWLYINSDDKEVGPLINPILDAIDAALTPLQGPGENTITLGGLASHVWTEGEWVIDEGTLGEDAVAVIPVNILVS